MNEKSTTTDIPSNFEMPEWGTPDFALPPLNYENEVRQSVCRGCPFVGDGCNACLHD